MMEDHSKLFNEINGFSQRKLKKVETKTTTASGDNVVEKRGAKGLTCAPAASAVKKTDLQVGLIIPGLMIGSQDVAHDKKTLDEYDITHILNCASDEIENKFEDDYNYCNLAMRDDENSVLEEFFEQAFEFIDEGRFRGNCFVHCDSSKPGLSRSTAICIGYLMKKEKKPFDDAFGEVKEARSFVRPNDCYVKQLKSLNEQLFGSQKVQEIEDPFTKKKRQEIEAEKAALKGGVNLKDRAKLFASSNAGDENNCNSCPLVSTPAATSGGRGKWNASANESTGDSSGNDTRHNGNKFNENIGKVKWNPESGDSRRDIRPNGSIASRTNSVNSESDGKKLTSIISLFNKTAAAPVEERSANFTINKNTAPAKKWKTVEPPPPPGFVRRTKSKRFNQDAAIKRIRSRSSLARNKSRDMKDEIDCKRDNCADATCTSGERNTADAAAPKTGQLAQSETAILTPWRKASKESPLANVTSPPLRSTPPPPPPPPPPCASSSSPKTTIQVSSQVTEPSDSRFRTSFSVSPAKSPEKSGQSAPVNARADSLPPAPPNRMVFGKVKPPPMKLIGSSLSTEQRRADAPRDTAPRETHPHPQAPQGVPAPPPRYDSKNINDHNNNNNTSTRNNNVSISNNGYSNHTNKFGNNAGKSNGHKGASNHGQGNKNTGKHRQPVYDYEESDSESDDESDDDDDDYTQIYDHRECTRGLNRSSTKEIISLIKSKTGADLTKQPGSRFTDIDENEEIDNLLAGLESEGIENLDWGELGIDLDEVKEIVEKHEDDDEEEEEEIEVEVEEEEEEEEEEDDKAIAVTYKINNRPGTRVA